MSSDGLVTRKIAMLKEEVALWKMDRSTNTKIAARLECIEQRAERKPRAIPVDWSAEEPS